MSASTPRLCHFEYPELVIPSYWWLRRNTRELSLRQGELLAKKTTYGMQGTTCGKVQTQVSSIPHSSLSSSSGHATALLIRLGQIEPASLSTQIQRLTKSQRRQSASIISAQIDCTVFILLVRHGCEPLWLRKSGVAATPHVFEMARR